MNEKFSLFLILLFGLIQLTGSAMPASTISDDEYEFYSALIESQFIEPSTKRIVIENQTGEGISLGKILFSDKLEDWNKNIQWESWKRYLEVERETFDDFVAKANGNEPLNERFRLPVSYTLVSRESFNGFFQPTSDARDGWNAFYTKYPDASGYISFSRVGFNKKKDQALVYAGIARGVRNMEGSYMLFVKEHGRWELRQKQVVIQA